MAIVNTNSSTIEDLKQVLKQNEISSASVRINANVG